jgi:ABC-type nitrate/sulfonate/bicarbonate transport system substrate-binding protein
VLAQRTHLDLKIITTQGTAEGFFRCLMEATGLNVTLVNGSPSQHAQQLASGEIDAF